MSDLLIILSAWSLVAVYIALQLYFKPHFLVEFKESVKKFFSKNSK